MNLKKFKVIASRDLQAIEETVEVVFFNLDHIISIKPINMVIDDEVIPGYWIRTTGGKKYRAIEIPDEIKSLIGPSSIP